MPSKKLTAEQFEKQKVALKASIEKRKAEGRAGKQASLASKLKSMVDPALENIRKIVTGEPIIEKELWLGSTEDEAELKKAYGKEIEFLDEEVNGVPIRFKLRFYPVPKSQGEMSKWIIQSAMATEKHVHELKIKRLEAKKKAVEADAGGYGDSTPEKVAQKAKQYVEEVGIKPVDEIFPYNPEWDDVDEEEDEDVEE
jgi:hypothetical protein